MMLYVAVPVLNETELLDRFLDCISFQTYRNFKVFICVNQPEEWWNDPGKRLICENNVSTLEKLRSFRGFDIEVIDRCSPGNGWKGRRHGVGWARKTVMDAANEAARTDDIILSLDADTAFRENYFASVVENFRKNQEAVALAVPYFHESVPDPAAYKAILRYEIYMRYYSLNLWRIGSPYAFTALGSAMACPVSAYRAVGGITPKLSGEDFYFLEKLRKYGRILTWNSEKVYPAARFSDRVYFGTGPAMIKGNEGDWSSYPLYSPLFFGEIEETYRLFGSFFTKTKTTKVTEFLSAQLKEEYPFRALRENAKDMKRFIRACHEKFDGLRVLQYLKMRQGEEPAKDETSLRIFLEKYYREDALPLSDIIEKLDFNEASVEDLEVIRTFLVKKEEEYQVNSRLL
jgi:glycosyltransferase involved in cell wall biosynthesis